MKHRRNKQDRYKIFLTSTGEFLAQARELRQAEKMVLAYQGIYRHIKIVDTKYNETRLTVS